MEYSVDVYVLHNNSQYSVGNITVKDDDTIAAVKGRISTERLREIIGYKVEFVLTEVRVTGKRFTDEVDFSDPTIFFTDAIRENEEAAKVLDYDHFDLLIETGERINNTNEVLNYPPEKPAPAAGGSRKKSNKKRRGGKRATVRKSKRKASKTRRHRK